MRHRAPLARAAAASVDRDPRLGRPLDDATLAHVRDLVTQLGLVEAARRLDLPRHTLAAAGAGGGLREGTRALLVARLAAHGAERAG